MISNDRTLFSLRGRRFGEAFEYLEVRLEPGDRRRYQPEEWDGALVVVESGSLTVDCHTRPTQRFAQGAVIFLWGLAVESIYNDQDDVTVLSAVRRRRHRSTEECPMKSSGRLDQRFSSPGAVPTSWEDVVARVTDAETAWLASARQGAPHVTPLLVVWTDDAPHFCTGIEEQKARNLATDPRCSLIVGDGALGSGLDVVVHGVALRQIDEQQLVDLAEAWVAKYGEQWRFGVGDGAFHGAGGTAWVYRIEIQQVIAFQKGDQSAQTTWKR